MRRVSDGRDDLFPVFHVMEANITTPTYAEMLLRLVVSCSLQPSFSPFSSFWLI